MWAFQALHMDWVCVHTLRPEAAIQAAAWGQPLGRTAELVALAAGTSVKVHALRGPADKLQVPSEELALGYL